MYGHAMAVCPMKLMPKNLGHSTDNRDGEVKVGSPLIQKHASVMEACLCVEIPLASRHGTLAQDWVCCEAHQTPLTIHFRHNKIVAAVGEIIFAFVNVSALLCTFSSSALSVQYVHAIGQSSSDSYSSGRGSARECSSPLRSHHTDSQKFQLDPVPAW